MAEHRSPSINLTGDGNIIGNNNRITVIKKQYFVGQYVNLRDAYIDPWPIFEQVNLDHFVGREWLLRKVDRFLRNNDRGYLILEAEAGLGKTTFLAWLVQQRGYIHHFVSLAPGSDGVDVGLKNLAAQLVLTCSLNPYMAEEILPNTAARSDFVSKLLRQAANTLSPRQKIVVVVDALDEAGISPKQNPMNLPVTLPEGIFFLVSQRPTAPQLYVDPTTTKRLCISFRANDADNREDMRQFLQEATTRPNISRILNLNHMTPDHFVRLLMDKCNGLWIYLHFVLKEIEDGEKLNIKNLPDGIVQYYARYWGRWCQKDLWHTQYLPILSTLAAAQTAISVERLVKWAGIAMEKPELRQLLERSWSAYITIERNEQEDRYRLYHTTLREFFNGKVKDTALTNSETSLIKAIASATQKAHDRIVNYYLEKWGGLESELIHQFDTDELSPEDDYAIRHIVKHMIEGKRDADLHTLLKLEISHDTDQKSESGDWLTNIQEWWRSLSQHRTDNIWYQARQEDIAGYLTDIARARKLVADDPKEIGRQIRYALISSSVRSQVQNLSTDLLCALVKEELLTPQQGLAYARQTQVPDSLLHLATIIQLLPESEQPLIIQEVLQDVENVTQREMRAQIIFKLQSSSKERQPLDIIDPDLARTIKTVQSANGEPEVKNWINDLVSSSMHWAALCVIQTLPNPTTQFEHLLLINKHLPTSVLLDAWNYIVHEDIDKQTRLDFTLRFLPLLVEQEEAVNHLIKRIRSDFKEKEENSEYKILSELMRDILSLLTASPLEQQLMGTILLFPYMSPSTLDKIAAKTLKNMEKVNSALHEKILTNLLPFIPKDLRDKILQRYWIKSREIGDKEVREKLLHEIYLKLKSNGFPLESFQVARKISSQINLTELATDLASSGYDEEAFECAKWNKMEQVPLELVLAHNALPSKKKGYKNMLKEASSSIMLLFLINSIVYFSFSLLGGFLHLLFGNQEASLKKDNESKGSNDNLPVWLSKALAKTKPVVGAFLLFIVLVPVFSLSRTLFRPILSWIVPGIFSFCKSHVLVKLPGVQAKILISLTKYMNNAKADQALKEIEQIVNNIAAKEEQRAVRQRLIQQAVNLDSLGFARTQLKQARDEREWFLSLANFPVHKGEEYHEIFKKDIEKRSNKYLKSIQTSNNITNEIASVDWLMPTIVKYDLHTAHDFWNELSSHIDWLPRSESLRAIKAMTPFIASTGGVDAIAEVTEAIEDVFHWWP